MYNWKKKDRRSNFQKRKKGKWWVFVPINDIDGGLLESSGFFRSQLPFSGGWEWSPLAIITAESPRTASHAPPKPRSRSAGATAASSVPAPRASWYFRFGICSAYAPCCVRMCQWGVWRDREWGGGLKTGMKSPTHSHSHRHGMIDKDRRDRPREREPPSTATPACYRIVGESGRVSLSLSRSSFCLHDNKQARAQKWVQRRRKKNATRGERKEII